MSEGTDETLGQPRPPRVAFWITAGVVFAVLVSLWQALTVEPHPADSPTAPDSAAVGSVAAPDPRP